MPCNYSVLARPFNGRPHLLQNPGEFETYVDRSAQCFLKIVLVTLRLIGVKDAIPFMFSLVCQVGYEFFASYNGKLF
jgi:hypothetical protein